jgi:two-component system sensor histidine kinase KdpD
MLKQRVIAVAADVFARNPLMSAGSTPPDDESLRSAVEAPEDGAPAEPTTGRGALKVFLGYASGVGKSFRMFDEGRRRRDRGQDVVVAAMQPDMDVDASEAARDLPLIPTRTIEGVPVIDVEAVLSRHPRICLVDGLAYDNPSGSRNPRRYEDVEELLAAGITVLTSVNLGYIAEQQPFVRSVIGRAPDQVVPQAFVTGADEVVVVDAPPSADTAAGTQQLSLLRQRALLLTADVVDHQLEAYLRLHGVVPAWGTQERILVCMTPRGNVATMLASGRRNADRFHGELFAVYQRQPNLTAPDRRALARNITLARAHHAHIHRLAQKDPVASILGYARSHGITQLFVGQELRQTWRTRLTGALLDRLIEEADGMDVRVFPH